MMEEDLNIDGEHGVTIIVTPDEMQEKGLALAGFEEERQARAPKSNRQRFLDRYGSSAYQLCKIWEDLQTTDIDEARVPPKKLVLDYFFLAHHFLRHYPVESERHGDYDARSQTIREWVWYFVEKMQALKAQKIFIPDSHVTGDDIWIMTIDGTMLPAHEKAGVNCVKDKNLFSFKHHRAGYNAEVGVSLWENRCVWLGGPGPAGENSDRVIFRKENGLRDKLRAMKKKAIADGGYTGDRATLSTPNGHDSPSVRRFKTRALKRHEKFNNMLKVFRCLDHNFRHRTEEKYKSLFEVVAVICQYHLENGCPLYNIYVGDM